ncbi:hypothetical protein GQ457_17G003000 [Hibiscus cannabinus]
MAPPALGLEDDLVAETQVFSNKRINVCLTRSNYLLWKQQVVLTIRGLGLEGYLDGSITTPPKMVRNSAGEQVVNPSYLQHVKQDSSLASWLLSTVSPDILPQLVGSETAHSVWDAVTKLFSNLSTTKIMNLHCRLRSLKKGFLSMQDYTMAIKEVCDLLATCGSPITDIEHIATILNGLPVEYEPSVAAITAIKDTFSVDNVVSILIDAETRLEDSSRYPVGIHYSKFNPKQTVVDVSVDESSRSSKEDQLKSSDANKVTNYQSPPVYVSPSSHSRATTTAGSCGEPQVDVSSQQMSDSCHSTEEMGHSSEQIEESAIAQPFEEESVAPEDSNNMTQDQNVEEDDDATGDNVPAVNVPESGPEITRQDVEERFEMIPGIFEFCSLVYCLCWDHSMLNLASSYLINSGRKIVGISAWNH